MPLPESYPRGVFFVGRRSGGEERIAGTGFLVTIRENPLVVHSYVVTAAHVIEGAEATFARLRTTTGTTNLEVEDWITHPEHDVAVAPIVLPEDHDAVATDLTQFIDEPGAVGTYRWGEIELGDVVYFIGLLGKVEAMTERNIPVVRAGVLAQLSQTDLPVKRSPVDATRYITAHLIDCRSFGGFSGAPCYLQKSRAAVVDRGITTEYRTLLLGLIGGHFDDWMSAQERTLMVNDDTDPDAGYSISDDIRAPVSTGVAYVIPAEFIRETLMRSELVEKRRADEEAFASGSS